tara:strand:+ start:174 stop:440 length:267 start_codon:yes stop_codon:yes gene_type:complete
MKVGDLVQINSTGQAVIWTEPFRSAIGILTQKRKEWYNRGEFQILWAGVAPARSCSKKFTNKYWWKYTELLTDWWPRSYLKHAKGKQK